jgi:hypothetical protein
VDIFAPHSDAAARLAPVTGVLHRLETLCLEMEGPFPWQVLAGARRLTHLDIVFDTVGTLGNLWEHLISVTICATSVATQAPLVVAPVLERIEFTLCGGDVGRLFDGFTLPTMVSMVLRPGGSCQ